MQGRRRRHIDARHRAQGVHQGRIGFFVTAGTDQLGKTAGKDVAANKPTYPAILGVDASRAELVALTARALAAIAQLGERADKLGELARFVALRES